MPILFGLIAGCVLGAAMVFFSPPAWVVGVGAILLLFVCATGWPFNIRSRY
jgi:hypothetical protein